MSVTDCLLESLAFKLESGEQVARVPPAEKAPNFRNEASLIQPKVGLTDRQPTSPPQQCFAQSPGSLNLSEKAVRSELRSMQPQEKVHNCEWKRSSCHTCCPATAADTGKSYAIIVQRPLCNLPICRL